MKNKKMMVAVGCTALAVILLICVIAWRAGGDKPVDPTGGTIQGTAGSSGDETTESTALESGLGESYFPEDTQIPTDTWPDDVTPPNNEPTKPSTEGTDPATDPSGESTTPSNEPSAPVTEPSEPATEPSEPATEPTEPATEPATEPTEPVHTHSYYAEVIPPVCNEDGYTEHICDCGDTYRDDFVPELGHKWTEWTVIKQATTSEPGSQKRSCTVCGFEDTAVIPNHVHSYTEEWIPPTCEVEGYLLHTCSCGRTYKSDNVAYLGHVWSEWEITVQPTTTSTGERVRSCSRCNEVVTELVPALDPETGEAYESYIDPRITVREYPFNTGYKYEEFSVTDYRTWGDPPSIWINEDGTWTVVYFDQNGSRVEFLMELPPEDYIRSCSIMDDGTYLVTLVGGYNK